MNGAEEQSGLCEGEGERGHFGELNSWFMAGSGDYMRGSTQGRVVVVRNVGSDLIGLSGGRDEARKGGVRGLNRAASFSWLAVLRLCSCTSPGLLWIGPIRPSFPSPPPSLISFASVELLAS